MCDVGGGLSLINTDLCAPDPTLRSNNGRIISAADRRA